MLNTTRSKDIVIVALGGSLALGFVYPKLFFWWLVLVLFTVVPASIIGAKRHYTSKTESSSNATAQTTSQQPSMPATTSSAYPMAIISSGVLFLSLLVIGTSLGIFSVVFYLIPFLLCCAVIPHVFGKLLKLSTVTFRASVVVHTLIVIGLFVAIQQDAIQGPGEIVIMAYFLPLLAPLFFVFSTSLTRLVLNRQ